MRNYDVYFEIFGKKMKTRILAENPEQAKEIIKNKIIFYKVEKPKEEFNEGMDILDNIFDVINSRKRS